MVNVLSACLFSGTNNNDVSACMIGKQAGLSTKKIKRYSSRSLETALLINSGDKKGYELIESDQDRTKYSGDERDALEEWLLKDCDLIIENPLKNDSIWKRDWKGNVVRDVDNKPVQIQKRLLMSSYRELHLYMIENYKGMLNDEGKIRFSEDTLRRLMPTQIKKAGDRYKQMCGCQCCVICKDMYQNLKLWRKRYIKTKQQEIDGMQVQSRFRTTKTEELASYKFKVMDGNENIHPERAWDASAQLACE